MSIGRIQGWWRELDEVTDLGPIVRRYFVIGAFDGALTILGIVIGAGASVGARAGSGFVIAVSASASIALAISSVVGAYEAERVEKKLHRHSIERAMLVELSQEHRVAFRTAALVSASVHGVAPIIAALVPVVPFLLLPDFWEATVIAIVLTLAFLFALGTYLGSLVRERILITGLRFIATGLGTAALLWALGTLGFRFVP